MRKAFIKTLTELVEKDNNITIITPDLGFTVFEEFRDRFPKNFLNCGVAEANGIGIAAGLALSGKTVFVYSIVPFITMRCYEQIRNDLCYHNLPVIIVGVGGGYSYGIMGTTHHAIEDIGIMRVLPNLSVVCPGDPVEVEYTTRALATRQGPAYLRLGKIGEKILHKNPIKFELGKAICMRNGNNITLLSTGNMLESTLQLSETLIKNYGVDARVLSMHTVKPIDTSAIDEAAKQTGHIYTFEEHNIIGGLGSAVAEIIAEGGYKVDFHRFGVNDKFMHVAGQQNYLRSINGLNSEAIIEEIMHRLR